MRTASVGSVAWVVGRGGLLGSAVERSLASPVQRTEVLNDAPAGLPWQDAAACTPHFDAAARTLFARAAGRRWSVLWCAGAGVVGRSEEALRRETDVLRSLLDRLSARRPRGAPGSFFFASSAGGIHGGAQGAVCDERSTPRSISAYGDAKLAQEELVVAWARAEGGVSTLHGRISNLYGPGQDLRKPQGLISQLCRAVILGRPAHVFVPLSTRRDYLYGDDCAALVTSALARLAEEAERDGDALHVRKILASGRETSIAAIISLLRRIAKRPVRLVSAPTPQSRLQPPVLRLRSVVWTDMPRPPPTPLDVGIHRVWRHQLESLGAGRLPMGPLPGPARAAVVRRTESPTPGPSILSPRVDSPPPGAGGR